MAYKKEVPKAYKELHITNANIEHVNKVIFLMNNLIQMNGYDYIEEIVTIRGSWNSNSIAGVSTSIVYIVLRVPDPDPDYEYVNDIFYGFLDSWKNDLTKHEMIRLNMIYEKMRQNV